jgi:hypothetical protein
MQMKCLWIGLLGALALVAGCASPLAVDGAPCPCPADYVCDPVLKRCVQPGAVTPPAQPSPDAEAPPPTRDPEATRCVQPGPVVTRPLAARAYRDTIQDLLGLTVDTSDLPRDDDLPDPNQTPSPFQEELSQRYRTLGDQVAKRAAANLKLPCAPDPPGQTACARTFAEGLGARAYRRPLTARELDELVDIYDQARRIYVTDEGYYRLIQHLLASEEFYLRKEAGETTGPRPGLLSLTQWEIAARLSYFLWGTIPDDELRAAAGRGELRTKARVQAQAERMLASRRTEAMLADFHRRWLRLEEVRTVPKEGVPEFSPELREALLTSGQETPILSLWREGGNQAALFRGPLVGNRAMSSFYGLSTPDGGGFEALHPLGAQKRFGVLTLPAVMSVLGHNGDSAVVQRGSFVVRRYLCIDLPLPPNLVVPPVREPQPDRTTRERFAEHSMNPTCWGCHGNMDPIGFALENYDGFGRWRESENGRPIDVYSGQVGDVLGQPFQGPEGLAQMLATRKDVATCMVHHWFTFALGRASIPTDDCTLQELEEAFLEGRRTLRPLLLAIVRSDAFLTRVAP